jgi:hypothetical protein
MTPRVSFATMPRFSLAIALIVVLAAPGPARAQLVNENLLVRVPEGYKIDYRANNDKQIINEMVPQSETVKNWTEMVTVQIFLGLKTTLAQMQDNIAQGWLKACPQGIRVPVVDTTENGYPVSLWQLSCPNNAQTGKPEWTWFKALRGNDSLYIVQKTFRFEPSKEQIATWIRYLKSVAVCDSRLPDRACPKTN